MGFWEKFARDGRSGESGYHSNSYHKFFEGYSEVQAVGKNGRGSRIIRTYTGVYYSPRLTRAQRLRLKVLYTGLFLLSFLALMLYSLFRPQPVIVPAAFMEAISFFAFFVFLYFLILYLASPQKMDVGTYKSVILRISQVSSVSAVIICILAVFYFISLFIIPAERPVIGAICFFCAVLSSVLIYGVHFIESRIVYDRELSKNEVAEDSIEIS